MTSSPGTTTAVSPTPELAAEADARFEGIVDPVEQALAVLRWAGETFGDRFAITSSMALCRLQAMPFSSSISRMYCGMASASGAMK